MMGTQTAPTQLFHDLSIVTHVPAGHLLRQIDRHVDLSDFRTKLQPFYSTAGRPSIDPELMMRMLIVGYAVSMAWQRNTCPTTWAGNMH